MMDQITLSLYAQIAVSQAVARSHDRVPRDIRVRLADLARDMGCRFTDKFEIAQRRIIGSSIGQERPLVQTFGIRQHPSAEFDHVLNVEMPLARPRLGIRHR